MTARDVYNAAVVAACVAKIATNQVNANTANETINMATVNAGLPPGRGQSAATIATIKAAAETYAANRHNAEMVKQVAVQAAKDTLRATGDTAPA